MVDFSPKARIEQRYKSSLQKLFKHLYQFIIDGDVKKVIASKAFSDTAKAIASRMITGLAVENAKDWRDAARQGQQGRMIYEALKQEMKGPIGYRVQSLIDENAQLIKSVSGSMAQKIATQINENAQAGVRSTVYAEKLKEWSKCNFVDITEARINLIARTETSKASTALTRARAENLGLNWYVWRTSEDARVRSSHKLLDGVLINWNDPPSPEDLAGIKSTLGKYHAGNAPNCRCYPEPIVNMKLLKFPVKVYTGGRTVRMSKAEFEKLNGIEQPAKQLEIKEIKPVAIEAQKPVVEWTTNKKKNMEIATTEINKLGFNVETSKSKSNAIAIFNNSTGNIWINPNSEWIKNPVEFAAKHHKSGYLSTPDPSGIIHHEVAHGKFKAPDNFFNNNEREIIGEQVSRYARMNPKEFVSEVYAALQTGKTFSEEIMFLFKRYAREK